MTDPIHCKKNTCNIVVKDALFRGYFARCETCGKSAGTVIPGSPDEAIAEWNRWVQIGGFIVTARSGNDT